MARKLTKKTNVKNATKAGRDAVSRTQKALAKAQRAADKAKKDLTKAKKRASQAKRETKKQGKQIVRTFKALRNALGQFTSKKKATKRGTKNATTKKQGGRKATSKTKKTATTSKKTPPKSSSKKRQSATPKRGGKRKTGTSPKKTPSKTVQRVSTKKRVYELRDLPEAKLNDILNGTFEDLIANRDDYNDLLGPGDVFGARVGVGERSGYTYQTFSSFERLIEALSQYRTFKEFGDDPAAYDDLVDMIKVVRFKGTGAKTQRESAAAWSARKRAELGRREEKKEARRAKQREREKQTRTIKRELKEAKMAKRVMAERLERAERKERKGREELMMERARARAAERKAARQQTAEVKRIHEQVKNLPKKKKTVPKKKSVPKRKK